ncbi:MAG TPA: PKD domain-containing protein [Aggregatilineaceae bacterium]|nr:PKD domain-containing protein [Aggregatilineaceae bacterium]
MARIFISYRRTDSQTITGRIYDRLLQAFGGPQAVFKDVDSIPLGVDFRAYLDQQIAGCDAVLVIIGPRWLAIADEAGRRRLDSPDDFVRLEIEFALRRKRPVVPVLVGGAAMPAETGLPSSLRPLAYRNAAVVRDDPDFHHDMDRLIGSLQQGLTTGEMPLPRPARLAPPRHRKPRSIRTVLSKLVAALLFAAILLIAGAALIVATKPTDKRPQTLPHDQSAPPEVRIADMGANPPSGQAPLAVEFGAAIDPPGDYPMLWEFGDGGVSDARNPVHTYSRPGHYTVHLTVHHPQGGSDSRQIDIQVRPFCGPGDRADLRLMAVDGVVSPDRVAAGINDFMGNCPNVKITSEYQPANTYLPTLYAAIVSANNSPDVFMFDQATRPDLVAQGLLFDLSRFLIPEQVAQYGDPQGRTYSLPYGPEPWQLGVASRSRNPEAAAALVIFLGTTTP